MKAALFFLFVLGSTAAFGDVREVVLSRTGAMGPLRQVADCARIQFPDARDTRYFRTMCLGAIMATDVMTEISPVKVERKALDQWLAQNSFDPWADRKFGELGSDLEVAKWWARRIMGSVESAFGEDPNTSYIGWLPANSFGMGFYYPTLSDFCTLNHRWQAHGNIVFHFQFDPGLRRWVTADIDQYASCR